MKKAEMELHAEQYAEHLGYAKAAVEIRNYALAIAEAITAWEHVDGMMRHSQRYEGAEFKSVECVDLVLKYAPLVFSFRALNSLEATLKQVRRLERDTSDDLGERLASARALMLDAHRLWNLLESSPSTQQRSLEKLLGGDQERWRWVAENWERMGLIHRVPSADSYELSLVTRMGQIVAGKCPNCGSIAESPKSIFLEESNCLSCRKTVYFVIGI